MVTPHLDATPSLDGTPQAPPPWRPVRTLAVCVVVLTSVFIAVAVASAFSESLTLGSLRTADEAGAITQETGAITGGIRQQVMAGLFLVANVTVVVVFLVWLHRCSRNLGALGVTRQHFTPVWAVAWWFVPFANWFQPYRVMAEIWSGSHPERKTGHRLLAVWWVLWLVSNYVGAQLMSWVFLVTADDYGDHLAREARAAVVSDGLSAVAGIFLICVVWKITGFQVAKRGGDDLVRAYAV